MRLDNFKLYQIRLFEVVKFKVYIYMDAKSF